MGAWAPDGRLRPDGRLPLFTNGKQAFPYASELVGSDGHGVQRESLWVALLPLGGLEYLQRPQLHSSNGNTGQRAPVQQDPHLVADRVILQTLGVHVRVEDQIPANYMPGIISMPVTGRAASGSLKLREHL